MDLMERAKRMGFGVAEVVEEALIQGVPEEVIESSLDVVESKQPDSPAPYLMAVIRSTNEKFHKITSVENEYQHKIDEILLYCKDNPLIFFDKEFYIYFIDVLTTKVRFLFWEQGEIMYEEFFDKKKGYALIEDLYSHVKEKGGVPSGV